MWRRHSCLRAARRRIFAHEGWKAAFGGAQAGVPAPHPASDMIPRVSPDQRDATPLEGTATPPLVVLRRLRKEALACYVAFGVGALFFEGFRGFLGLTCSALVVMIGHLWLERIVDRLLRPTPESSPWNLGLQVFARLAVMGAALGVAIFIARFSPVSVILGFSIIVGAVMVEAVYSALRPGAAE